jgi:hypothetical protein
MTSSSSKGEMKTEPSRSAIPRALASASSNALPSSSIRAP